MGRRGMVDCMIAVAMSTGARVLAHDRDLAALATVVALVLDDPTATP
jgi:hypothetical protein